MREKTSMSKVIFQVLTMASMKPAVLGYWAVQLTEIYRRFSVACLLCHQDNWSEYFSLKDNSWRPTHRREDVKIAFKINVVNVRIGFRRHRIYCNDGFFEHGTKIPNTTKGGKFLDRISDYQLIRKNSTL